MMIYILINIILLILTAGLIYRLIEPKLNIYIFLSALMLKILAGLSLGYLYFYYYKTGDTIQYHQLATVMANTARNDISMFLNIFFFHPLPEFASQPRAWFMVQVVSVFHILTGNNYWLTSSWLSIFAFSGLYYLASVIHSIFPEKRLSIVAALLFFPSVIFWSSGVIKESLAIGCVGFILGIILRSLYNNKNFLSILAALAFLLILWQVKYYIAAVLFLVLIPFAFTFTRYRSKSWLILLVIFVIAGAVSITHPNFYPQRLVDVVYHNYSVYQQYSPAEGAAKYAYEKADILFVLLNAPQALFTALFMPLWPHEFTVPVLAAAFENILLLFLTLGWFIGRIKNKVKLSRLEKMLFIYCIILAVFLGLSTPNYGTLSRFRVSFLPFYIWLILADNYFLNNFKSRLKSRKIWIKNP